MANGQQAVTDPVAAEVLPLIPTILITRFRNKTIREIFGRGEAREAAKVTLRLLARRCGPLSEATTARIQALPLE